MNKLNLLTVIIGLTVAFTTIGAQAAFVAAVPTAQLHPHTQINTHHCADDMGHMRSVNGADINSIEGQYVMLIRVCEDLPVAGRNNYGPLFVNGNVNALRVPIARNDTLISALYAQGLDQNDVVSLRFGGDDSIVLYVYDRDMN